MPTPTTLDPINATVKAIDALLAAIGGNPGSGAVTAYRSAITRHGHNLLDQAGPEALAAVLAKIRAVAPDKAAAEERERIEIEAWAGFTGTEDQAA